MPQPSLGSAAGTPPMEVLEGAGPGSMLLEVEGMGAVGEAEGAVAAIVALALGSIIVGCTLGAEAVAIPMLVIAGVVTTALGTGALEVTGGIEGAMVADAPCVTLVNGDGEPPTGSEPQPPSTTGPSTTEPSTVTRIVGDMDLRDSNIALIVFFTGITPKTAIWGAPSTAGWGTPASAQGQLSVRPYW